MIARRSGEVHAHHFLVHFDVSLLIHAKYDAINVVALLLEELADRLESHWCSLVNIVAEDSRRDARDCYTPKATVNKHLQAGPVGSPKKLSLLSDGSNGVDDVRSRQTVSRGYLGVSWRTSPHQGTFVLQVGAGSGMYSSVDSTASHQGLFSGVDYGVDLEGGDVTA